MIICIIVVDGILYLTNRLSNLIVIYLTMASCWVELVIQKVWFTLGPWCLLLMVTVLVLDLGVKFIKHRQGCIVIRILTEVILSKKATQLILYSIILNNIWITRLRRRQFSDDILQNIDNNIHLFGYTIKFLFKILIFSLKQLNVVHGNILWRLRTIIHHIRTRRASNCIEFIFYMFFSFTMRSCGSRSFCHRWWIGLTF